MTLTKSETREKIYSEEEKQRKSPNEYEADVSGTCLDRCYYYLEEGFLADNPVFLGYLDDRAVSPESLERAYNDLCYLADEITPERLLSPKNEIIVVGFAEGVDQPTRDYLAEHSKDDQSNNCYRYTFVIDCPARAVLYDEYPKYRFRREAKIQKEIAQELQYLLDQ